MPARTPVGLLYVIPELARHVLTLLGIAEADQGLL